MRHYIDLITEGHRKTYTQEELAKYFVEPELYKKVGTVEARYAIPGEWIATVIDGEIETTNTANDGDVVVKNPGGETYIIDASKFERRYEGPTLSHDYQTFLATGTTHAVRWDHAPARFKASWGEMMIIDRGDMLCSPTREPDGDLYRIEAEAFETTYEKVEEE